MDEETNERGFKIYDKRRFDASGRPRESHEHEEHEREEVQPESASVSAASTGEPAGSVVAEPQEPAPTRPAGMEQAKSKPAASGSTGRPRGELTFSSFVVGLASQAFTFLGAAPDSGTGVVRQDLAQAAAMIEILSILREKTAGNLADDESHLMEEVLYELKLQYVAATRHPTNPPGDHK